MIAILYWFLLIIQWTWAKCPLSCQCYEQSDIYSIFCVQVSLTSVPNSFNFNVKILNLTGNNIPILKNDFHNPHYKSLELLDLKNNHIKTITKKALRKLRNLLEIDLSDNNICQINGKIFVKNRFLNTIRLNGNPIRELNNNAFPALIYLKNLYMQACKLNKIHSQAFLNTPRLETLNLKDNNLKHLPPNVLRLTQLKTLQLEGNPWKCDENLWHVLKWLQCKNSTNAYSMLCVYGETENAILWDTMEVNNETDEFRFRDKRAIDERIRNKGIATVLKGQHEQPLSPKRDTFTTAKTLAAVIGKDNDNNCTQNNEYSPGKAYKRLNTTTTEKSTTKMARKDKNTLKNSNQTWPMRYNNAKITRNYVQQPLLDPSNTYKSYIPPKNWNTNLSIPFPRPSVNKNYQQPVNELKSSTENVTVGTAESNFQFYRRSDDMDEEPETNFFEENHKIVLTIEVILIVVLLAVLYKLWNEGHKRNELGANVPLNNSSKKVKNYDSQTSVYKRYSLSDEEYSDVRNDQDHDEGKLDTESGYLSYHRYNSIEGENNDNTYNKRRYSNDRENTQHFESTIDNDNVPINRNFQRNDQSNHPVHPRRNCTPKKPSRVEYNPAASAFIFGGLPSLL